MVHITSEIVELSGPIRLADAMGFQSPGLFPESHYESWHVRLSIKSLVHFHPSFSLFQTGSEFGPALGVQ
jgi:hypothetical protein